MSRRQNATYTVIEFTQTRMKVLQKTTDRGQEKICFCDVFECGPDFDQVADEILSTLIKDQHITASRLAVLISRKLVIMKQMELPAISQDEIRKMVELQLMDQVPYSMDEMVLQTKMIKQDDRGYTRVLVTALPLETSYKYIRFLERNGLHVKTLGLSSYGMLGWWNRQTQGQESLKAGITLLINIDRHLTEICFCEQAVLLYSRSLHFGFQNDQPEDLNCFVEQIELSIKTFLNNEMGADPRRIIIVSSHSLADQLKKHLFKRFQIETVHLSLLQDFCGDQESRMALMSPAKQAALMSGLGTLFSEFLSNVNLAPQEIGVAWRSKLHMNRLLGLAIHFFIILLIGLGTMGLILLRQNTELGQLDKRLQEIKPVVSGLKQKKERVDAIERDFNQRILVPKLVEALLAVIPEGMSFRTITLDEKGRLELHGFTSSASSVNQFQSQLVRGSLFKKVNLLFAKQKHLNDMDVTDFKISCDLF